MADLILPGDHDLAKWLRGWPSSPKEQRPRGVDINYSADTAKKLLNAFVMNGPVRSLTNGAIGTLQGSAVLGPRAYGMAVDTGTVAGSQYVDLGANYLGLPSAASSHWSARVLIDLVPNGEGYFWGFGRNFGGQQRAFGIRGTNTQLTFLGYGANFHGDVVGTPALTGLIDVVCTWDGTTIKLYLNGAPAGSGTPSLSTITALDTHRIGGTAFKNGYGNIYLCEEYSETLTAEQVSRLHRDPYRNYKSANDAPFLISVPAGGGAPVLSSPNAINVQSDRATPQVTLTF